MRWIWRGLIVFAGVAVGFIVINHYVERANTRNFYAGRPILSAMHDAVIKASESRTAGSVAAAQATFRSIVPPGTPRGDVLRQLNAEGITCTPQLAAPNRLVCGVPNTPMNNVNWHIELAFDSGDKLDLIRVMAFK